MFNSFPSELHQHGLEADARTLVCLYELMSAGLIRDLGGLYSCGERLVVKDRRQRGPYIVAFFAYFLDIPILPGQTLDEAVIASDTFAQWRGQHVPGRKPTPELVNTFLENIFHQRLRLQPMVGTPPVPAIPDDNDGTFVDFDEVHADHSETELAEIMKRLEELADQQKYLHKEGTHYVGTEGESEYGSDGSSAGSVRVGGSGAHLSARLVLNDMRYFPLDMNAALSDNNVDAALAALRGAVERQSHLELDIDETVRLGAKRHGLIIPQVRREEKERLNVMLFIDNGGFSMDVHVRIVRALFKKMKIRFAHEIQIFYFHNMVQETVYRDVERRKEPVSLESLKREGGQMNVLLVGDASMAPYELHSSGQSPSAYQCLREMAAAFPKIAWLNPVPEMAWRSTETIGDIRQVVEMFPLTPRGIEQAVLELNRVPAGKLARD
jgi:uncharacterized protein with von Willebrand factor type A (vWA) domain